MLFQQLNKQGSKGIKRLNCSLLLSFGKLCCPLKSMWAFSVTSQVSWMKPFPMSGPKLQDQALTLKIYALSASYLIYIAVELINKHSASYIYPLKLRDHAPLALKRLNDLPRFMLLNKIDSYEMEMFSSFFNLLRERFIRQRWSLWPSFVLLGSLWTPLQATEGKEESQALIFAGISYSLSYSCDNPASKWGFRIPHCSLSSAFAGLVRDCCGTGLGACSHPGGSRGRLGTSRCHSHPQEAVREERSPQDAAASCSLNGSASSRGGSWGPLLGGSAGWAGGWQSPGGWRGRQAQPGGLGSAQPRAELYAGCRRSAGLGAGRLSIFSEGFIEWIPAVWLHTEILS